MMPVGNVRPSEMDVYQRKQVMSAYFVYKKYFLKQDTGYFHLLIQDLQKGNFAHHLQIYEKIQINLLITFK